jgi:hypothetical protein
MPTRKELAERWGYALEFGGYLGIAPPGRYACQLYLILRRNDEGAPIFTG